MKENEFSTDLGKLEEEWIGQPQLAYKYGEKLANARQELDLAERELDVAESEASKRFRRNPEAYGFEKATDATTKDAVVLDREVTRASAKVIDLKHKVNILVAAMSAVDNRKKSLEKLVDLHGQQYWSKPREPESAKGMMEKAKTDAAYGNGKERKQKVKKHDG